MQCYTAKSIPSVESCYIYILNLQLVAMFVQGNTNFRKLKLQRHREWKCCGRLNGIVTRVENRFPRGGSCRVAKAATWSYTIVTIARVKDRRRRKAFVQIVDRIWWDWKVDIFILNGRWKNLIPSVLRNVNITEILRHINISKTGIILFREKFRYFLFDGKSFLASQCR